MKSNLPVLGSRVTRMARPLQIVCMILWFPLVCVTVMIGFQVLRATDAVFGATAAAAAAAFLVTAFTWSEGEGIVRELDPRELRELKADIESEPDLFDAVGRYLATGRNLITTEATSLRHEASRRRDERAVAANAAGGDGKAMAIITGTYRRSPGRLPHGEDCEDL